MRKLEELKELAESINEVLRFYRSALDDTKRTIDEKNETIKTLKATLDNQDAKIELLKATIEKQPLVVDIDAYRESLDEQKKEVERLELEVSRSNSVIKSKDELIAELKAKIAKLEEDSETIKVDNLILQEKAASLEKENELMSRDVDSLWRKKVALEDENKALKEENESLKKKIASIEALKMEKENELIHHLKQDLKDVKLAKLKLNDLPKFEKFDELDHSAHTYEYAFNHLPADKPQIFKQDVKYIEFLKANGFSSTETIKKHFGVSQQAVCAHLRRLIALGIVVRSHEHPSDARQTYGINPDAPEYSIKRVKAPRRRKSAKNGKTSVQKKGAPQNAE